MILVPEQYFLIKESLEKCQKRLATYSNYLQSREVLAGESTFRSLVGDSFTDINYQMELKRKDEYENILAFSSILYDRTYDSIGIGTKFRVSFLDDDEEELELMLVDSLIDGIKNKTFVSVSSPLGKAVIGACVGDEVYYDKLS